MTPDNLDAFVSDELQFNNTSRWVDDNVPQIRVPSVIIGALGDQLVEIDHVRRLAKTLPDTELITVDGNHVISQPSVRRCAPALTTPPWKAIRRVARRKAAAIRPVRRDDRKAHPEVVATQSVGPSLGRRYRVLAEAALQHRSVRGIYCPRTKRQSSAAQTRIGQQHRTSSNTGLIQTTRGRTTTGAIGN